MAADTGDLITGGKSRVASPLNRIGQIGNLNVRFAAQESVVKPWSGALLMQQLGKRVG